MKPTYLIVLIISSIFGFSFYHLTKPEKATVSYYLPTRAITMCGVKENWIAVFNDTLTSPVLFNNLGDFAFPISSKNQSAQAYFNQGIRLYYGFNHREAFKAFREASRLDPSCAICWWGQALALGPNINAPTVDSASSITAYDAIQKAIELKSNDTRETNLIQAQAVRYEKMYSGDRSSLDNAYVEFMRTLAQQYPNDPDILSLAAEAIMDVHFWDYWERDGKPKDWTPEILDRLTKAMELNPKHPGANHFYIHAVEASHEPDKGLKSADVLKTLMPGAGHLVHMPSHIFIRTGQYADGSHANVLAVKADEDYFATSYEEGMYSLAYYPHNYHFLWACSTLEGNFSASMQAARDVQSKVSAAYMGVPDMSVLQHLYATPMYTLVRFGKWDEIAKEKLAFPDLPYLQGVWSYANGLLYVRKNDLGNAWQKLADLKKVQTDASLNSTSAWINNPVAILRIAEKILEAEIYWKQDKPKQAQKLFIEAMSLEDALRYNEPADWHQPVRESYGAFLISQKQFAEAEKIYREDLQLFRDNGWSLLGLYHSLIGQKKYKEAEEVNVKFNKAWAKADIKIRSSRY